MLEHANTTTLIAYRLSEATRLYNNALRIGNMHQNYTFLREEMKNELKQVNSLLSKHTDIPSDTRRGFEKTASNLRMAEKKLPEYSPHEPAISKTFGRYAFY